MCVIALLVLFFALLDNDLTTTVALGLHAYAFRKVGSSPLHFPVAPMNYQSNGMMHAHISPMNGWEHDKDVWQINT